MGWAWAGRWAGLGKLGREGVWAGRLAGCSAGDAEGGGAQPWYSGVGKEHCATGTAGAPAGRGGQAATAVVEHPVGLLGRQQTLTQAEMYHPQPKAFRHGVWLVRAAQLGGGGGGDGSGGGGEAGVCVQAAAAVLHVQYVAGWGKTGELNDWHCA